jgi:thioredoxin-dependent peroxiredoxin
MANQILDQGSAAPDFSLQGSDGKTYSLSQFKGKQRVVLYFYPKADTPGCTTEACGFRDRIADYQKESVVVLGVSPDPVADVTRFAQKFHLNFPLLADADHAVCEAYGVWQEKNRMGKTYWGVVRTTFVIGRDGRIEKVFQNVKPDGHEAEVLAALAGT